MSSSSTQYSTPYELSLQLGVDVTSVTGRPAVWGRVRASFGLFELHFDFIYDGLYRKLMGDYRRRETIRELDMYYLLRCGRTGTSTLINTHKKSYIYIYIYIYIYEFIVMLIHKALTHIQRTNNPILRVCIYVCYVGACMWVSKREYVFACRYMCVLVRVCLC